MAGGRIEIDVAINDEGVAEGIDNALSAATDAVKTAAGVMGLAFLGGGVSDAISHIVGVGTDLDTVLNQIKGTSGATAQEMAAISDKAKQLGNDMTLPATSTSKAASAMLELSKGGLSLKDSMDAAKGSLALAAAAQIDAGRAAEIQADSINTFNLKATDAGHVADVLANAANKSSAEIEDIAQGLAQAGAVASGFNMTIDETAGALAVLASNGIKGSDAGTLLKSALLALQDTGEPASAAMEELGISVYNAKGKFAGFGPIMAQLKKASGELTEEQYNQATSTLFGSDAMRLSMIAANSSAGAFKDMTKAVGEAGSAQRLAAAFNEGLPGAMERIQNSVESAELAIYDLLRGPMTEIASFGADKIGAFSEWLSSDDITAAGNALRPLADQVGKIGRSVAETGKDLVAAGGAVSTFGEGAKVGAGVAIAGLQPVLGVVGGVVSAFNALPGPIQTAALAMGALAIARNKMSASLSRVTNINEASRWQRATLALRDLNGSMRTQAALARSAGQTLSPLQRVMAVYRTSTLGSVSAMRGFTTQVGDIRRGAEAAGTPISRLSGTFRAMGERSGSLAAIGRSFTNAQTSMSRFGSVVSSTAGTVSAGMTTMRVGASGLMGALGGPWGVAIAGAVAGLSLFAQHQQKAKAAEAEHKQMVDSLTQSINLQTGALNNAGKAQMAKTLQDKGILTDGYELGFDKKTLVNAASGDKRAIERFNAGKDRALADQLKGNQWATGVAEKTGMSDVEIAQGLYGAKAQQDKLKATKYTYTDGQGREQERSYYEALTETLDETSRAYLDLSSKMGGYIGDTAQANRLAQEQAEVTGKVADNVIDLREQLGALPKGQSVELDADQIAGAETLIDKLGFSIQELPNGKFRVTADTASAGAKLTRIAESIAATDILRANPTIDADTTVFEAGKYKVDKDLAALGKTITDPTVRGSFDKWTKGKDLTLLDIARLDTLRTDPKIGAKLQEWLDAKAQVDQWQPPAKRQTVTVEYVAYQNPFSTNGTAVGQHYASTQYAGGGQVRGYADGGGVGTDGAIRGPGSGTSDSIAAMVPVGGHVFTAAETAAAGGPDGLNRALAALATSSASVPVAGGPLTAVRLSNGELYADPAKVAAAGGHAAILALRQQLRSPAGHSLGGAVSAEQVGKANDGLPYISGARDCSMWVSWIVQAAKGEPLQRLFTTYSLLDGQTAGLQAGASASDLIAVGTSREHMAATVMTADGPVNTESGGNSQPSQVRWGRGAAGAFDPQFTNRYHLPINLINPAPTPEDKPADDRSPFIPDAAQNKKDQELARGGDKAEQKQTIEAPTAPKLEDVAAEAARIGVRGLLETFGLEDSALADPDSTTIGRAVTIAQNTDRYRREQAQAPTATDDEGDGKKSSTKRSQAEKDADDKALLDLKTKYEREKLDRKQAYEREQAAIRAANKDKDVRAQKLLDLKQQRDRDELDKKFAYQAEQRRIKETDSTGTSGTDTANTAGTSTNDGTYSGRVHPKDETDPYQMVNAAPYNAALGTVQWDKQIAAALQITGIQASYNEIMRAQGDIESKGDPKALGPVSADGTPSGVWQVKPPTFASMRDDKLPDDVFNVLANGVAALNWTAKRWGGPQNVWPTTLGYADGGVWSQRAKAGGLDPMPATKAAVVAADAWRVIGDRAVADEFFIPDTDDPQHVAIGAEWARRRGLQLVQMHADGGIAARAQGGQAGLSQVLAEPRTEVHNHEGSRYEYSGPAEQAGDFFRGARRHDNIVTQGAGIARIGRKGVRRR